MRRVLALVLASLPFSAPAAALPPYVFTGDGRISPGHGYLPDEQSITLSGTLTAPTGGVYACAYGGTETGSIAFSVGDMRGWCGGPGCPGGPYVRVGAVWTWLCTQTTNTTVVMQCVYTPHQTLPTTSYDLACAA